jgi:hypothetical protein
MDAQAKWIVDQWEGDTVTSISDGHETKAKVKHNDDTTLQIDGWSDGIPDVGAEYAIIGNKVTPDISSHDIALALLLFYEEVPDHFNGILTNENGWRWDAEKQEYIQPSGKPLNDGDLKGLAILFILAIEQDMRRAGENVGVGRINIEEFQEYIASTLKNMYIALGALGAGGISGLTPEILDAIKGDVDKAPGLKFSLDRLQLFAAAIAAGDMATVEGIVERAGTYAESGLPVYEDIRVESHRNAKDDQGRPLFLFYRNMLTPGENCSDGEHTEGCIETADAGWQPIGSLPEIGARTCNFRCRCYWRFSLTGLEE